MDQGAGHKAQGNNIIYSLDHAPYALCLTPCILTLQKILQINLEFERYELNLKIQHT